MLAIDLRLSLLGEPIATPIACTERMGCVVHAIVNSGELLDRNKPSSVRSCGGISVELRLLQIILQASLGHNGARYVSYSMTVVLIA